MYIGAGRVCHGSVCSSFVLIRIASCCVDRSERPHRHVLPLANQSANHTHPFNGLWSRTTRVSRYQKGKTNVDFTEARDSEWQWHQLGICKSATHSRQITTPAPHHSVFYRPDALPAAQPTASKHWRHSINQSVNQYSFITAWQNAGQQQIELRITLSTSTAGKLGHLGTRSSSRPNTYCGLSSSSYIRLFRSCQTQLIQYTSIKRKEM